MPPAICLKISKLIWTYNALSKPRCSCSLGGHLDPPSLPCKKIMMIIEPKMVSIFWVDSPISFERMSFWVFARRPAPNHILLKYRCPSYRHAKIEHVYRPSGVVEVITPTQSVPHVQLQYKSKNDVIYYYL